MLYCSHIKFESNFPCLDLILIALYIVSYQDDGMSFAILWSVLLFWCNFFLTFVVSLGTSGPDGLGHNLLVPSCKSRCSCNGFSELNRIFQCLTWILVWSMSWIWYISVDIHLYYFIPFVAYRDILPVGHGHGMCAVTSVRFVVRPWAVPTVYNATCFNTVANSHTFVRFVAVALWPALTCRTIWDVTRRNSYHVNTAARCSGH